MKLPILLFTSLLSITIAQGGDKFARDIESTKDRNGNVKVLIAFKDGIDDRQGRQGHR